MSSFISAVSTEQRSTVAQARQTMASASTRSAQQVDGVKGEQLSASVKAKYELNTQILQASANVSLQSGDNSQALLFRSAIDRINELLAPELGADAIQSKMSEDNSPEGTAGRILSLSTGFFDAYAAQHPDTPKDQLAKDFVDTIRSGFEKGFNEATDILGGLKVFDGDIKSGIMKTYELVSKGYDDFLASKLQPANDNAKEAITA